MIAGASRPAPLRHLVKRGLTNKDGRFCWTRLPWPDRTGATWHLFRRSEETGVWHAAVLPMRAVDRRVAAGSLAAARRELLARVDALDLAAWGIAI